MKTTEEKKHVYFRSTTASQRIELFRLVNEDNLTVKAASIKCRMSKRSYYYWLQRFKDDSYAGLKNFKSKAPKNPGNKKPKYLVDKVIALKTKNPKFGRPSIANLINKEHDWEKVISPSTVRTILLSVNLQQKPVIKIKPEQKVKHAENENDVYNIDFAFVKTNHVSNQTIPAVSGSSGKLKYPPPAKTDAVWPGQIYNEDNLTFEQQTNKYIDLKNQSKEKKEQACDKEAEKLKAEKKN